MFPELCWTNTDKADGEDIANYKQSDCNLERLLDMCLLSAVHKSSPEPDFSNLRYSETAATESVATTTTVSSDSNFHGESYMNKFSNIDNESDRGLDRPIVPRYHALSYTYVYLNLLIALTVCVA